MPPAAIRSSASSPTLHLGLLGRTLATNPEHQRQQQEGGMTNTVVSTTDERDDADRYRSRNKISSRDKIAASLEPALTDGVQCVACGEERTATAPQGFQRGSDHTGAFPDNP